MAESKTGSATAINCSYNTSITKTAKTTNHPNEEKIRKSRELFAQRLNEIRKREEEEQKRKLRELHEQLLAAEKLQQLKLEERKRRLCENRNRENDRRLQVIDRKQKLLQAEWERKEAILRRNLEREERIELLKKKRASCHVIGSRGGGGGGGVFAFGSSTPRQLLEPLTPSLPHFDVYTSGCLFDDNHHHHRRSTSSNNMYMSAYSTLSNNNNNKLNISNTSAKNQSPNRSSHNLSLNARSIAMSSSMYEVFNWNEDFNNQKNEINKNNRNNISTNSINQIGSNDTNNNLNHSIIDDSRNNSGYFRVIRRRTDLIPTIPLSKLNSKSTQALGSSSSSATSRSNSSMNQAATVAAVNRPKWQKQNRPRSIAISGLTRSQILTAPETIASAVKVTKKKPLPEPETVRVIEPKPSPLLSSEVVQAAAIIDRKIGANTEEEAKLVISERRRRIREEEQQRRKLQAEQHESANQVLPLVVDKTNVTETIETIANNNDGDSNKEENSIVDSEQARTERYNREQAEKLRIELAEKLEKEEHERELRRKRVEAIMLRTRNGTPNTKNGGSAATAAAVAADATSQSLDSSSTIRPSSALTSIPPTVSTPETAITPSTANSAPASFTIAPEISPSKECDLVRTSIENLKPAEEEPANDDNGNNDADDSFHMLTKPEDGDNFLNFLKRPRNDSKCDNVNNSGSNGDYNSYQNLNLIT